MEEVPLWLWIGGGLVLGGAVFLAARHFEQRRSDALEQAALRLGLSFQAKGDPLESYGFAGLPLFRRGRARKHKNVARGGSEWVFDYSYTTRSGKNSSTVAQTVAVLESSSRSLPRFELAPAGLFARLASVLGGRGIDFEEDPGFSRAYRLKGPDQKAIRETFQAALRQQLASEAGWSIEGDGRWLVLYRRAKRIRPEQLADFVETARRISALFH